MILVWSSKHSKEVGRIEDEETKEKHGMDEEVPADFTPF